MIDSLPQEGIVYVVAAIAVPLFGFLGIIVTGLFKLRSEAREARSETDKAVEGIATVEANTEALSHGFPDRVDRKLDEIGDTAARLESRLTRVESTVTSHLEWHINERKGQR
jgi:hypothetical protein